MEKVKKEILSYFFEEPNKEFYVREIANLLKKSPTTISKYLNQFMKQGILVSESKFGHLFFRASENQKFKQEKLNFNLEKIRDSGILDFFEKELNYPDAIIVFGSFAKAENGKNSDLDFLVVTPVKKDLNFEKFEKKLGRNVQVFLYSKKQLSNLKNKELLNSFINGIVLKGYMEVF